MRLRIPLSIAVKNACNSPGTSRIICKNQNQAKKAVKFITRFGPDRAFQVYQKKTLPKGMIIPKSGENPWMIIILPKPRVEKKDDGPPRIIKTTEIKDILS